MCDIPEFPSPGRTQLFTTELTLGGQNPMYSMITLNRYFCSHFIDESYIMNHVTGNNKLEEDITKSTTLHLLLVNI